MLALERSIFLSGELARGIHIYTCMYMYLHSGKGECVMVWVSTKTAVVVVDLLQLGNMLKDD